MRFGLCKWSFTPVHREAGTVPNPWDARGLATVAFESGLEAIELDVEDLEGDGATVEALLDAIREKDSAVILDTGGEEPAEAIGRSVEHALEIGAQVRRPQRRMRWTS